jgi:hypothetical protein
MPPLMTAVEMFDELARQGVFVPVSGEDMYSMPSILRPVPTITTYGTSDPPLSLGAHIDAGLDKRTQGNRD